MSSPDGPTELEKVIAEGRDYLWQIREENHAIFEDVFSQKLSRLDAVSTKIFNHVEAHPKNFRHSQIYAVLFAYYLKIGESLSGEFGEQSIQGENITQVKTEIRDTLDTINIAFENLLDSLFQDDALDISTDISVLETMLAQEGLTGDTFHQKKP